MARNKSRISMPAPSAYHLAAQLQARAIDSLYSFAEGHHTMDPIDTHTITDSSSPTPGDTAHMCAPCDGTGHLAAAAHALQRPSDPGSGVTNPRR